MSSEVLLVGSIPLDTVDEVFRTFGATLGPSLAAMPDGEVGPRKHWISRIHFQVLAGHYQLEPGSKPFELAQNLVRLFRSLDSWLGQDDASARSWLTTPNLDLGDQPLALLATVRGLLRTSDYVDAQRARV